MPSVRDQDEPDTREEEVRKASSAASEGTQDRALAESPLADHISLDAENCCRGGEDGRADRQDLCSSAVHARHCEALVERHRRKFPREVVKLVSWQLDLVHRGTAVDM